MIEILLDKYVIYVLMGGAAICGIVSKLIAGIALRRLVKASGNMNKSTHPLMRLVRAKFEHACMISEKVENVGVFVDKYLYEYRVAGIKLHSLRRMERASSGVCLLLGILGAALAYSRDGMQDKVLQIGASGVGIAIFVFLVHLMTDEGYRMDMVRNYMVDYLENICLHRYEKTYQRELKVMSPEAPVPDFGKVSDEPKEIPPVRPKPEPDELPDAAPPVLVAEEFEKDNLEKSGQNAADILAAAVQATRPGRPEKKEKKEKQEKQPEITKEILIRQILEEFMA